MTTRHAIAPSAWGLSIAVVVGGVGAFPSLSTAQGGYGSGNGGVGFYNSAPDYSTGGGGGTSVSLGVIVTSCGTTTIAAHTT